MDKKLTAKEVLKKYKGRYIEVRRIYDYDREEYLYEIRKSYKEIHENTCLVLSINFYEQWLS